MNAVSETLRFARRTFALFLLFRIIDFVGVFGNLSTGAMSVRLRRPCRPSMESWNKTPIMTVSLSAKSPGRWSSLF